MTLLILKTILNVILFLKNASWHVFSGEKATWS